MEGERNNLDGFSILWLSSPSTVGGEGVATDVMEILRQAKYISSPYRAGQGDCSMILP
jgi:hypothetical protein